MSEQDPNGIYGALADSGYLLLPYRGDGTPGDSVAGFDHGGSVSVVAFVNGEQAGGVEVLIEGSADGVTWSTVVDFSPLTHDAPAFVNVDTPPAFLRATLTGAVKQLEVRAYPHLGPRGAALLDGNGAFTNATKPVVLNATAADLLAALVSLNLVTDGT